MRFRYDTLAFHHPVMPMTCRVPGRPVSKIPQSYQTRFFAFQIPVHESANLFLAAFPTPEPNFVHLPIEILIRVVELVRAASEKVSPRNSGRHPKKRRELHRDRNTVHINP